MPTTDPHAATFTGVQLRFESSKSFDDLRTALLGDIGHEPVPISDLARTSKTWEAYSNEVERYVGPSGFMLFALIDHGEWLEHAGIHRKVLRVVLGNPLIAITMLRHDVTAGLFAPVELLLVDLPAGSCITYVKPSSLMVIEPNAPLLAAAEQLDAKLAALARKATS